MLTLAPVWDTVSLKRTGRRVGTSSSAALWRRAYSVLWMTAALTGYVTLWQRRTPQHQSDLREVTDSRDGLKASWRRCAPAAGFTRKEGARRAVLLCDLWEVTQRAGSRLHRVRAKIQPDQLRRRPIHLTFFFFFFFFTHRRDCRKCVEPDAPSLLHLSRHTTVPNFQIKFTGGLFLLQDVHNYKRSQQTGHPEADRWGCTLSEITADIYLVAFFWWR